MKFLVDAQLPPALAVWLQTRGNDAVHIYDAMLQSASDAAIRKHALDHQCVLITKDRDFIANVDEPDPPILWVRTGNISNSALYR